jgi:DNA-binding CsgD family transcriptional regulator
MRLGKYDEALDDVVELRPTTPDEDALLRALESVCHSLRGAPEMARRVLAKIRPREMHPTVQFEIAYARFLIGWSQGSCEAMEAALACVDVQNEPSVYGAWLFARSWLAGAQERYADQLDLLVRACTYVSTTPEARDVCLLAHATQALVHLVREIASPAAYAFAEDAAETLAWTDDLQNERFLTLRGLAWASALRGLHEKALQYAYASRDLAPTARWITACYADQAYLARMGGQQYSAGAMLRHAVKNALALDWESTTEERIALLNLIELTADDDVDGALRLLDSYDGITAVLAPRLALAHDRRLKAMENYVRAGVYAAAGRRAEAIELLRDAYFVFDSIKYAWRAAATAMMLHSITDDRAWLHRAGEAVAGFSDSSVARDIQRRVAELDDTRLSSLTRAQRKVFDLLCEGLPDKSIAETLGISPETVKNHAARVRAIFGVRSRAALIASMHQKTA